MEGIHRLLQSVLHLDNRHIHITPEPTKQLSSTGTVRSYARQEKEDEKSTRRRCSMGTVSTSPPMLVIITFRRRRCRCSTSCTFTYPQEIGYYEEAGGTPLIRANLGGRRDCACAVAIRDVSDGCLTDNKSNTEGGENISGIGGAKVSRGLPVDEFICLSLRGGPIYGLWDGQKDPLVDPGGRRFRHRGGHDLLSVCLPRLVCGWCPPRSLETTLGDQYLSKFWHRRPDHLEDRRYHRLLSGLGSHRGTEFTLHCHYLHDL